MLRVLVIEPSATIRHSICRVLGKQNTLITECESFAKALLKLKVKSVNTKGGVRRHHSWLGTYG